MSDLPRSTITVAEFADALAKLPAHYLELPYLMVRHVIISDDIIVVAHRDHIPIEFYDGDWHQIEFKPETVREKTECVDMSAGRMRVGGSAG